MAEAAVTVKDNLAAGTSFVGATTPDCANSGGTVTCTSAGLARGASVTWTITARVSARNSGGTVRCTSAGVASGASVTWTSTAHVSASYSGTTVDNTAAIATSATPDNVPGND